LYQEIVRSCLAWSIGAATHATIDRINISNATMKAMQRSLQGLRVAPDHLLIDGIVPRRHQASFPVPYTAHVKGDAHIFSIAAASIVAKVTRDRLMRSFHKKFSQYGFSTHKGYGTAMHYRMLAEYGPSRIHRKTFFLG